MNLATSSPTTAAWISTSARTAHVHQRLFASTQWVPTNANAHQALLLTPLDNVVLLTNALLTVTVLGRPFATMGSARTPVKSLVLVVLTPYAPQQTTAQCAHVHPEPTETPRYDVYHLSALPTQTVQVSAPA